MTAKEKQKIRGTDRGLIRGRSRISANLGRVSDKEYAEMCVGIRKRIAANRTAMHKGKYEAGSL